MPKICHRSRRAGSPPESPSTETGDGARCMRPAPQLSRLLRLHRLVRRGPEKQDMQAVKTHHGRLVRDGRQAGSQRRAKLLS